MCEFISWIEYEDQALFLTDADLNTKHGKELIVYLGNNFSEDIKGHGAIRFYYEIGDSKGHNKECTDFSKPNNFPPAIQDVIKKGKFNKIGIPELPNQLLAPSAFAEYKKIQGPALAEYKKVIGAAFWNIVRIKENRVADWR